MSLERQVVHITLIRVTDDEWLWELRNAAGDLLLNSASAKPARWHTGLLETFDDASQHAKLLLLNSNRLRS